MKQRLNIPSLFQRLSAASLRFEQRPIVLCAIVCALLTSAAAEGAAKAKATVGKAQLANKWNERGRVASRENRLEEAAIDFTKAIHLDPKHALYSANRGLMYEKLGRNEEALLDYDRALELNAETPLWYRQRSSVLVALKRFREAVDTCDVEIEIVHQLAAACICLNVAGNSVQQAIGGFVAKAGDCDAAEFKQELAMAYSARAYANYSLGNRDAAMADLMTAVRTDPNNADLHVASASVYADLKENDKAFAEVSRALELNPKNELAYGTQAYLQNQVGETDEALADYDKALALAPNNPRFYFERGNVHYKRGEKDAAKTDYDAALKLNPRYAEVYNNRSLLEGGEWTRNRQGIRDLSKSIKFDPKNPVRYNERGLENLHAHKSTEALADFNKAIYNSSGQTAELIARRGAALSQKGNQTQALAEFNKALGLDPNLVEAYFYRSLLYYTQEKFDEALPDLNRTIELAPDQPSPYLNRGQILQRKKRYEEAIRDYTRYLELDPPNTDEGNNRRAQSYFALGQLDEATKDLEEAIRRKPDNVRAFAMRALIEKALGQPEEAARDFQHGLTTSETNPIMYNDAAWTLAANSEARLRDGEQAVRYATKACKLTRWKNSDALDTLAAAYAETGKFDEATRYQTKAIQVIEPKSALVTGMRERLALYKNHQPFRE